MTALASRGFLARNPVTAHYTVGLSAFRLGTLFLAQTGLREAAVPVIRELARTTGEAVNLNVVVDRRRVCIEKAESTQDIRHFVELGRPTPLHAGASGRLLLAYLDAEEVEAVIAEGLPPMGPRTVTDAAQLRRALAEIRRRGYAASQDERVAGAAAVSAPVRDGTGRVVAGLTISGPSYRFPADRVRRYVRLVQDAAARISASLGHMSPAPRRAAAPRPVAPPRRLVAAR
jgi:DNA-binding IclR family transcriptional regulator